MSSLAPRASSARSRFGSTLVETMIGASLAATVLGVLATSSSVCLGIVRAQRETVASNILLQERLEQLRAGGWRQITEGLALRDQVLAQASAQERLLGGLRQQLAVSPYPPDPASTPLQVEKLNGNAGIVSQPTSAQPLRNRLAVRVDLRLEWTSGQNRRVRARETSTVMSLGGLIR